MNTCDTCKWWRLGKYPLPEPHQYCEHPKIDEMNAGEDELGYVYCEGGKMTTGPKFGCIHHEAK